MDFYGHLHNGIQNLNSFFFYEKKKKEKRKKEN